MTDQNILLLLLIGAFCSLWIPHRELRLSLSFGLLAGAGLAAYQQGALAFTGMAWAGPLWLCAGHYHHENHRLRQLARTLFLGQVLALGFGLLPGFEAVILQDALFLKPGSAAFTLHIRPDMVLAGHALLAFAVPLGRDRQAWRTALSVAAVATLATALPLFTAGWLSGFVTFEPQPPALAFLTLWSGSNLLFVSGIEEGFFRGIVQRSLLPRLGPLGAITAGAIVFGLAHYGGGGLYVVLATLAGLGYGAAYHFAGQRIEAAMLTHFGVNLLHLLLFSYPYST